MLHLCHDVTCNVALQAAQCEYEEKLSSKSKVADKTMHKLAWQVQELEQLIKCMRKLLVEVNAIMEKISDQHADLVSENVAKSLCNVREELLEAIKKLSKHQRTAATHVFVFMLSTESRSRKPYALPVQCLPIRALRDRTVRDLLNKIILCMKERNMNVAGMDMYTF